MANSQSTLQELLPQPDEELVARVVGGDGAVFELLMRRHNQQLFRVARAVVLDDNEAEDIVQDAFVRAFTHLGRFEGRCSVSTWLTRIAFHEALRRRRRARRARLALLSQVGNADTGALPTNHDGEPSDETRSTMAQAMDSLPTGLRSVLMLRLVQGLSTRETAACLRLSESNVKVSLHRGRRMLQLELERQATPELRGQFTFGAERCDRVVHAVFARLGVASRRES